MTLTQKAKYIAEQCSDAYSVGRYKSWMSVARVLLKAGWKPVEVEAFMRSKHTRWCADFSDKPYGHATGKDVERYIANERNMRPNLQAKLDELVQVTWSVPPTYPF